MSKIKTLAIDIGHNVSYDTGACGIFFEDVLNLKVAIRLIERLKSTSLTVVNCTPTNATSLTDSLKRRCDAANNSKADLFISIHHNACPGGYGTEALCIKGGLAENTGISILAEISKLGFRNRGIKDRSDLYVIRNTIMPALVIECAFVDSPRDMNNYNPISVADAIFTGLSKALVLEEYSPPVVTNPNTNNFYIVKPGDTLWGISRMFNTSVDELVRLNNIKNRNLIHIGEKILIK